MEQMGFVNIIKPTGMTSSDVVMAVKKTLKTKRVGHLGTLDPAASGVLPVAVGKATKFFDYFLNKDKVYRAVVEFGVNSDTLDSFGNITNIDNNIDISENEILSVLPKFIGEISQVPPKYSAKKVGGKKAYELARENINFELKPRKLTIFSIKLVEKCEKNRFLFEVHCEAGTYIRSLFNDIAGELSTSCVTSVIIRTKSGAFNINNAISLEDFKQNPSIDSIEDVLRNIQKIEVSGHIAKQIINGVKVSKEEFEKTLSVKVNDEFFIKFNGELVGLYNVLDEKIEPVVFVY